MGTGWSPFSGKWKQRAVILLILLGWVSIWVVSYGTIGVLVFCGYAAMIVGMTASYYRRRPGSNANTTSAADEGNDAQAPASMPG